MTLNVKKLSRNVPLFCVQEFLRRKVLKLPDFAFDNAEGLALHCEVSPRVAAWLGNQRVDVNPYEKECRFYYAHKTIESILRVKRTEPPDYTEPPLPRRVLKPDDVTRNFMRFVVAEFAAHSIQEYLADWLLEQAKYVATQVKCQPELIREMSRVPFELKGSTRIQIEWLNKLLVLRWTVRDGVEYPEV